MIVDVEPQIHDLTGGESNALRLSALLNQYILSAAGVPMPKRGRISAGRRPPPGASPVGSRRGHSAGATSVVIFTALSEAQSEAIRSTKDWPKDIDWRREIEQFGRDYWAAQATREMRVKELLKGKPAAKQRRKFYKAWESLQQSREALAGLVEDGLLDDDFPHPDFESPKQRLQAWLSDYDLWIQPFAGRNNPIQAELEWRLIDLWKRSGGKVRWSREKDDPGTPYAPLVNFLTLTIEAILGKELKPSGVAKMIDRHRGRRQRHDPFLMYAMHLRITGIL